MTARLSGGEGEMILCGPPEDLHATLMSGMHDELKSLVAEMPDEAVIIKPLRTKAAGPDASPFDMDPLTALRYFRLGIRFSPLLPLVTLLLVAAFRVRSLKGWLRWWGIPMLIAGLVALGAILAAPYGLEWLWLNQIATRIPTYVSTAMSGLSRDLVDSVLRALAKPILIESAVLSLTGLGATISSFHVRSEVGQAASHETS
jgi:hypothetical protein